MKSIAQAVEEIVQESAQLEELLSTDVVNLSSLSRGLLPQIEEKTMKKVTQGSVLMALKRFRQHHYRTKPGLYETFTGVPELIVRSNLFEITVRNSPTLIVKQKKLLEHASLQHNYFATITHGVFETTIIANHQVHDFVRRLYKDEYIISNIDNLSSITIKFPNDIIEMPGVYYTVLKTLAWAGMSIAEVVSTYSELTVILDQAYVDRAFALIKNLFQEKKR